MRTGTQDDRMPRETGMEGQSRGRAISGGPAAIQRRAHGLGEGGAAEAKSRWPRLGDGKDTGVREVHATVPPGTPGRASGGPSQSPLTQAECQFEGKF